MRRMGIDAGRGRARMVELLDENKDGVVTFEEFKKYTLAGGAAQVHRRVLLDVIQRRQVRGAPRQRNAMRLVDPPPFLPLTS